MRAYEFLFESEYEDQIKNLLMTLLTTQHAENIPTTTIKQLKDSLADSGFTVNKKWIRDQISNVPIVKSVDKDTVVFDLEDSETAPAVGDDDTDKDKRTVSSMAKKALSRRSK